MNKNIFIVIAVLIISITKINAQQTPNYTFWKQNLTLLNPAFSGSTEKAELNMSYKNQWNGIANSPKTQFISGQTKLNNNLGFGASIVQDRVFIQRETNVFANLSYKLQLTNKKQLYLGVKAGGSFFNADLDKLQTEDPINQTVSSKFNPNFGIGAYLKTNTYFISLSAPRLLKAKRYEEISGQFQQATDELLVLLGGGYYYQINSNVTLAPAIMTRYVSGTPLELDASLSVKLYSLVELGANYRLNDSVAALAILQIAKPLQIGFAYDFVTSTIKSKTIGGPEVYLKLLF